MGIKDKFMPLAQEQMQQVHTYLQSNYPGIYTLTTKKDCVTVSFQSSSEGPAVPFMYISSRDNSHLNILVPQQDNTQHYYIAIVYAKGRAAVCTIHSSKPDAWQNYIGYYWDSFVKDYLGSDLKYYMLKKTYVYDRSTI